MSPLLTPHKIIDFASFDEKILAKSMILLYSGCFTFILCGVAHYIYWRYPLIYMPLHADRNGGDTLLFKILGNKENIGTLVV
jgi:hypothetical protein